MKYLAILPFLLFAGSASASPEFDALFEKASKDGCMNREEIREIQMHPEIGGSDIRPLSINELNEGSKILFDLDGPNNEYTVYVSFYPEERGAVRLFAFGQDGCMIGMKDIPNFMASMFLDKMAAE
jgi:hypothetical protein